MREPVPFVMVKPRLASLDGITRTFAHRGASAHAPANTLEAFVLALEMGASGIETDAWLSADGVAILDHDGLVGPRLRRKRIGRVKASELPPVLCRIEELYDAVGPATPISIDIKDAAAIEPILAAARRAGDGAEEALWLCHPDITTLTSWRRDTPAHLVLTTKMRAQDSTSEQLAAQLRERGIDGLNLPHREWNGGLVAVIHRFERYALGWGLEHEREMARLIDIGIDALYSDYVDRMTAVVAEFS